MSELQFASPAFLFLLLLIVPGWWLTRRSQPSLAYSSLSVVQAIPSTLRSRFARIPSWLMCLSFVLLVIGLARPQSRDATSKIARKGIGIMLVVDRSGSMDARDLEREFLNVNRLEVVKDVLRYFITGTDENERFEPTTSYPENRFLDRGRPNDMIGLVAFSGFADSLCPLTLDHGNLLEAIRQIKLAEDRSEAGTAIGEGLGLAVERLRKSEIESKIVILLTDGVNNRGELDPLKAADLAASENIRVYCIGAGTNGYAPFPVQNPLTGRTQLQAMQVEIDEEILKAIAVKTGGKYFRATDKQALKKIYDEIDRLEKSDVSELKYLRYHEHYEPFVMWGTIAVIVGSLLQLTLFRRFP